MSQDRLETLLLSAVEIDLLLGLKDANLAATFATKADGRITLLSTIFADTSEICFCTRLIILSIANLTTLLSAHPCDRPTDGWTDGIGIFGMIGDERRVMSALALVQK
jgi:hypothetical protein